MKKLDERLFKTLVENSPLISIDILIKNENRILLGKRINKPAKGYFFSIGGRIMKNESISLAIKRIMRNELNIEIKNTPRFLDVFEHFYEDSIFSAISTHYVGLLYEYEVGIIDFKCLPKDQHNEYKWLSINQILMDSQVHENVKNYFRD